MRKQSDIIKQLSDRELFIQVYISQGFLACLGLILSFFLFDDMTVWLKLMDVNIVEFVYYGLGTGLVIVGADLVLMTVFPKRFYDDGGINQRLFQNRSLNGIILIAFVVSVSEELLFRGVIQTSFGYVFASLLFAFVHVRYLTKPVLFVSILMISFYIGYVYELTGNLLVSIVAHFTVDFILGCLIRYRIGGI